MILLLSNEKKGVENNAIAYYILCNDITIVYCNCISIYISR